MLLHDARRAARVGRRRRATSRSTTRTARAGTPDRIARGPRALDARGALAAARRPTSCRRRSPRCTSSARRDRLGADRRALRRARPSSARRRSSRSTARSRSASPTGPPPAWSCSSRCSPTRRSTRYQPLHAAHADLLSRAGDAGGAARAYERAIALTANAVERAELERRLAACADGCPNRAPSCDVLVRAKHERSPMHRHPHRECPSVPAGTVADRPRRAAGSSAHQGEGAHPRPRRAGRRAPPDAADGGREGLPLRGPGRPGEPARPVRRAAAS